MLDLPCEEESPHVSTHLPDQRRLACIPGPHLRSPRGLRHVGTRGKGRRGSSESDRIVSRGTVQTLRERHGRVSVLLGVGPHGSHRSAPSAAASLGLGAERIFAYYGPARTGMAIRTRWTGVPSPARGA